MLIFEHSRPGRHNPAQAPITSEPIKNIPESFLRKQRSLLPEVSEMQVVRHYTRLSQKNFSDACNVYVSVCNVFNRFALIHDCIVINRFIFHITYR